MFNPLDSVSDLLAYLVTDIDLAENNPTVQFSPVEVFKRNSDDSLITEILLTVSANVTDVEGNLLSEKIWFTGGAETVDANNNPVVQYTATLRKLGNDIVNNPPVAADQDGVQRSHSSGAECVIDEGWLFRYIYNTFTNTLSDIEQESNLASVALEIRNRANKQDIQNQLDTFETDIQGQQDTFEALINTEFDNFVANQREITAIINDDPTLINISSGNWLDNGTERSYAGVVGQAAVLSNTRFYELTAGTGALNVATGGFTTGAYPIAKVTADGSGVTSIVNYGAAYQALPPIISTSAGAGDENKLVKITSSGRLDPSVIPSASLRGVDWNCPWDIADGFDTFQVAASATYTVPSGKVALVENVICSAISNIVNVDAVEMFKGGMNRQTNAASEKLISIIPFAEGTDISPDAGSAVQGILCNENASIEPVIITLNTSTSYTVPSGKVLRVLWWKNTSTAELTLDSVNIWFNASGLYSNSPSPFFAKDGEVLACLSGATDTYCIGYLIPDTFIF